jgi:WD40 repeat protein
MSSRSCCWEAAVTIRFFSFLPFLLPALTANVLLGQSSSTKPEIVVQTGHTYPVAQVAFSQDGKLLASSAFTENSIKLWELESGRQLRTFVVEGGGALFGIGGVSQMVFSGNGDLLAAASQKEVDVWNVRDGERLYRFPLGAGQSSDLSMTLTFPMALSTSGRLLAWIEQDKVEVHDLSNRGVPIPMPPASPEEGDIPTALAFSPDERELALLAYAHGASVVSVVELAGSSARKMQEFQREQAIERGRTLTYSPDGHLLVASTETRSRDKTVAQVHDLIAGKTVAIEGPGDEVSMSGDGSLIAMQNQSSLEIWEIGTKRKLFSYSPPQSGPFRTGYLAIDFSGNGKRVAIGDNTGVIHIVDPYTGEEQVLLVGHSNFAGLVNFDDTGSVLYAGSKTAWDLKSGLGLRTIPGSVSPRSIAARNGSFYAADAGNGVVKIWDLALQKVTATLNSASNQTLAALTLSPDGSLVALVRQNDYSTAEAQQQETRLRAKDLRKALKTDPSQIYSMQRRLAFSADNPALIVHVYDTRTGGEKLVLKGHNGPISAVTFSDNGSMVASAANDGVKVWSAADGKLLSSIPLSSSPTSSATSSPFGLLQGLNTTSITSLSFSPDGKSLAASLYSFSLSLDYSAMMQQQMIAAQQAATTSSGGRSFGGFGGLGIGGIGRHKSTPPPAPAPNTNPSQMMQVRTEGPVLILDSVAARPIATLPGHKDGALSVAYSRDGKLLATSGRDGFIRIWDCPSGSLRKELGASGSGYGLAFSPGGKLLASTQSDGTTGVWEVASGQFLATLISLYDGADWLVVTPEGLFDGSPAAWNQILWRYSRNTFDVAPVESYFNEYFYPGLLAELVSGKRPKPPQTLAERDRRQPQVQIRADGAAGSNVSDREALVKIEVSEAPASAGRTKGSGAKDVRLFRNGALVKVWHGDILRGNPVATLQTKARIIAGENNFTAYAFNDDNVKSRDGQLTLQGSDALRRSATTFVVTVGIDQYENPDYNLRYAVADAKSVGEAIQREQAKISGRVEIIPLYNQAATRTAILQAIADVGKQIQPEDHVVLFFASHGTAEHDRFYLIPHDLGFRGKHDELDETAVQTILQHSISDRDLEQALEPIDASQIIVILDACNSGQALQSEERRRGPMNSRGLAQLAYEKGMYILTASQSYQAALEASQLGHGLLTYALVSEGLDKREADDDPHDGKILDREWLDYATARVPDLQQAALQSWSSQGRAISFVQDAKDHPAGSTSQRPKVFYRRELSLTPWIVAESH